MKPQVFSAPLVKNDEGRDAFEIRADNEPICQGVVNSIYPTSFQYGDKSLPKLALMQGYFDSDYIAKLPKDAVLAASCSCGSPACGHKWARVKIKGEVVELNLYGHQSLKNPQIFLFTTASYTNGLNEIYKTIEKGGLLDHINPTDA